MLSLNPDPGSPELGKKSRRLLQNDSLGHFFGELPHYSVPPEAPITLTMFIHRIFRGTKATATYIAEAPGTYHHPFQRLGRPNLLFPLSLPHLRDRHEGVQQ